MRSAVITKFKLLASLSMVALIAACGQDADTTGTEPAVDTTPAVADTRPTEPMTSFEPEDISVVGTGVNTPSVVEWPVALEQGQLYELTFAARLESAELEDALLIVDLFPDELPESTYQVTDVDQMIEWTFSSDEAAMASPTLRFFAFMPEGTSIEVSDISLLAIDGVEETGMMEDDMMESQDDDMLDQTEDLE